MSDSRSCRSASTSPRTDLVDLRDRSGPHPLARGRDRRRLVAGHPARLRAGARARTGRRSYDWRATEARLNAFPQFRTELDGLGIHFLHVRSPEPDALPLVHHPRLAGLGRRVPQGHRPAHRSRSRTAATPADAFHVVCPSLPGYGFSDQPAHAGWRRRAHRRGVGRADGPARLRPLRRAGRRLGLERHHDASAQQRPRARRRHPPQHGRSRSPTASMGDPTEQRAARRSPRSTHYQAAGVGLLDAAVDPAADARLRARRLARRPGRVDRREVLGLDRLRRPPRERRSPATSCSTT